MMSLDGNVRENLKVGMSVEINPQSDRSREVRKKGQIEEILTSSVQHPHGILVKLTDGQTGRVKQILDSSLIPPDQGNKPLPEQSLMKLDMLELLSKGENHFVEFKSSALWSLRLTAKEIEDGNPDIKAYGKNTSKFIIAKSITAFLNSDGGTLVIGLKENKNNNEDEVIGVQSEFFKLPDPCVDGYRRMIVDQVIKPFLPSKIFNHINDYLTIKFEVVSGKTLCVISVLKSDTQVFLKKHGKDCFYVRVDATTREIQGEDMANYCVKRFGSK